MKFHLVIDKEKEPSVTVVCDRVTSVVTKIEEICKETDENLLYGYTMDEIIRLSLPEIACFFTRDNKLFACVDDKEYAVKLRVKQVLELVDDSFIKINQGCIVNVRQIQRFKVSIGAGLKVVLKNGYTDYVARREVKNVKRRLGL
jgi:DNA-binding LytR/AlgR family response regulator